MAAITQEQLENASRDADDLGLIINGAADLGGNGLVTTRTGGDVRTIQKVQSELLSSTLLFEATYADLALITDRLEGAGAEVLTSDAGTHTDPVVGGVVNNSGRYRWSSSPAGWERIGDVDSAAAALAGLAALPVQPMQEEEWELPSALRMDDLQTPVSGTTADETGLTVTNGSRFYAIPAIATFGLAVGDTIRVAYKLLSGSAGPTSITFRAGTALVSTVNFSLQGGWYVAEAVIPATTTIIRFDWTNGTGGSVKFTRPRFSKKVTQQNASVPMRTRFRGIASDPGTLSNIWTGVASLNTSAGTGAGTINADGSVTVPSGALVQITSADLPLRAVGDPVTILCRASSLNLRNINVRFTGNVSGTVTQALRPVPDVPGWYYWSGVIPTISGSSEVLRYSFEPDNRVPGTGLYAGAAITFDKFTIVDGLSIPKELPAAAPDTYPDGEIVVNQTSNTLLIAQRAGPDGVYKQWTFSRYDTTSGGNQGKGWRLTGLAFATRGGETAITAGTAITDSGEFETAIKENGKADFMGGATHGDAIETRDIQVFINGSKVVPDGSTAYRARTVEIIQRQTLDEDGAPTTGRLDLITKWTWRGDELRVRWYMTVLNTFTVDAGSYFGMFPGLRAMSNTAFASPLYEPYDITSEGHAFPSGAHQRIITTGAAGVKIDMECTYGWDADARMFIEDAASRNKIYFMPWGASATTVLNAGVTKEWEITYRITLD